MEIVYSKYSHSESEKMPIRKSKGLESKKIDFNKRYGNILKAVESCGGM